MPCHPKPRSVRHSVPFGQQRRQYGLGRHHRTIKPAPAITAWRNGYACRPGRRCRPPVPGSRSAKCRWLRRSGEGGVVAGFFTDGRIVSTPTLALAAALGSPVAVQNDFVGRFSPLDSQTSASTRPQYLSYSISVSSTDSSISRSRT